MPDLSQALTTLRRGGLVAFPTETVYGLGADATNRQAILRIFRVKGRPPTNPLIVHVADASVARRYAAAWPESADRLARQFWPGPLTLVLPKQSVIVPEATAGRPTVALRAPDHPLTLELLRQFDGPLAGPSANRSNHLSPTTAQHVRGELGDAIDLILDGGPCQIGIESTVLDLTAQPTILRPGAVTRRQIEELIGPVQTFRADLSPTSPAPGLHPRHYAPRAAAFRFDSRQRATVDAWCAQHADESWTVLLLGKTGARENPPGTPLPSPGTPGEGKGGGGSPNDADASTGRGTPTLILPLSTRGGKDALPLSTRRGGILSRLVIFAGDIKIAHTVFALPFALLSTFLAAWPGLPAAGKLGLILLCMVSARTVAMSANRLLDARLDAANPRTAGRAIPRGRLSPAFFAAILGLCAILFIAATSLFWIIYQNPWPTLLAVPVLLFLCAYPLLKRLTRLCHYYLGAALGLAPICAWVAMRGDLAWPPVIMAGAVLAWTAGFDILYACQDYAVDVAAGLHSVPAKLGIARALWVARATHACSAALLIVLALTTPPLRGILFYAGVAATVLLLIVEHALVRADDLSKLNLAFFTINGLISLLLGALGIVELMINRNL